MPDDPGPGGPGHGDARSQPSREDAQVSGSTLGQNTWLLDEMYRTFQESPEEVSESWREFLTDYRPGFTGTRSGASPASDAPPAEGATAAPAASEPSPPPAGTSGSVRPAAVQPSTTTPSAGTAATAPVTATPTPTPVTEPVTEQTPAAPEPRPLKGAAARIVANMEKSLTVPTATSVRTIPAKLLEENRLVINRHLRALGRKVSFTHLIGWAVVRAALQVPAMNVSYTEVDGKPAILRHERINLGLAADVKKADGSRSLVVPSIKDAGSLDFVDYLEAYEEIIRKVARKDLVPDDLMGTTITLTNPGMIGTVHSVPRLMPGQGLIVGVGSIAWPPGLADADPGALARLGAGKVLTLTSTYDHRIIQGAESGEFLRWCETYLRGDEGFFDDIFTSLGVRQEPLRLARDVSPDRPAGMVDPAVEKNGRVLQLINMYRVRGHLVANLNPLDDEVLAHPELDPEFWGLTVWDLDREFWTGGLGATDVLTLREIVDRLRSAYSGTVGIEYMHIQEPDEKQWIQSRLEAPHPDDLTAGDKKRILHKLNEAEAFETFLHTKYVGQKRFSLEGSESTIPLLDALLSEAADTGASRVTIGMSHRGRLNVLANTIGKSFGQIFREFEGDLDPDSVQGTGDVKYHLGADGVHESPAGNEVRLEVAANPSHLEAVDPVVEGMVRGRQDETGDDLREREIPILLHGDAAFAGQGVVAETFNLSQLPGYETGGTVHVVINNGIGFTTKPEHARSSVYATDVAKVVQSPIFHVNGDDPEACVRVAKLAFAYRRRFNKDVVVDLVCYRRHGHNEADEPAFTQPRMYDAIRDRRTVRKRYTEQLVARGDITLEEAEAALDEFRDILHGAFDETREEMPTSELLAVSRPEAAGVLPHVDTGVSRATLDRVLDGIVTVPDWFHLHPKLERWTSQRREQLGRDAVDWATAEALAFGTLLLDGVPVRLSGQDSARGTFSQRHAVFTGQVTEKQWCPLQHLSEKQAPFSVYDSLLSEYAALGFEYGYSVVRPDALTVWEAQFGDFVNGAQIVIDQFLVAAEDKWDQTSGLVLLLPHGFEGQGPEHSSARLERFLILCAEDNVQVVAPTTAAQYFHVLRRQMQRPVRKPLVTLTPKSFLRLQAAASPAAAFEPGTSFEEVLDDGALPDRAGVRRVLLCCGKVYHDLRAHGDDNGIDDVAIVRVEQLFPFPEHRLRAVLDRYPLTAEVVWVQEEPANMGSWSFVRNRIPDALTPDRAVTTVSRRESGSPATGTATIHRQEQEQLLLRAFG